MRVHANQPNPYAQLDALYAAEKAAAKKDAARTRRKLTEFASALAGEAIEEAEAERVQALQERPADPREQNQQQNPKNQGRKRQKESEAGDGSISEWA